MAAKAQAETSVPQAPVFRRIVGSNRPGFGAWPKGVAPRTAHGLSQNGLSQNGYGLSLSLSLLCFAQGMGWGAVSRSLSLSLSLSLRT